MPHDLHDPQQTQREENKARVLGSSERGASADVRDPLLAYIQALQSVGPPAAERDLFVPMGNSKDVHALFRTTNKVRNKRLSKRETERTIKEIWRDKMAADAATAPSSMPDFVLAWLTSKYGTPNLVAEAAYNLLVHAWKFSWDPDCELWLKIVVGEIREEVYLEGLALQEDLTELCRALDKAQGEATGTLKKVRLL